MCWRSCRASGSKARPAHSTRCSGTSSPLSRWQSAPDAMGRLQRRILVRDGRRRTMMYVAFSKLFWFFAAPSSLLALLALAGAASMVVTGRRRGFWLLSACAAALGLLWLFPVGEWAIAPLENRFPQPQLPEHDDGILLADGFVAVGRTVARNQVQLISGGQLTAAAALARRYPRARIVLTAGEPWIIQTGHSEAEFARGLIDSLGLGAAGM